MSSHFRTRFGTRLLRVAMVWLGLASGALAQTSQPQTDAGGGTAAAERAAVSVDVSPDQLRRLVDLLRDDAARERFVEALESLVALQEGREAEPSGLDGTLDTVGAQILGGVSDAVGQTGLVVGRIGEALVEVHQFALRVRDQALDGEAREMAARVAVQLFVTLGAAIGGLILARLAVRRPYRNLSAKRPGSILKRLPHLIGRLFLDLACIGATAVAGYGAMLVVQDVPAVRVITLAVLNAIIATSVVYAVARLVLAPSASGIRIVPVPDFSAAYLYVWVRRLTVPAVYGYFLLQMAVVLGLEASTYRALVSLLGLLITVLVIVFVLQNRTAVSDWISGGSPAKRKAEEEERRRAEAEERARREAALTGEGEGDDEQEFIPRYVHVPQLRFLRLRRALAPVWHLLAVLYVLVFYVMWVIRGDDGWGYMAGATAWTALVFGLAVLILSSSERLLRRAFSIGPELREQFPDLEARANRYLPILSFVIKTVVLLAALLGILQAWEIGGYVWLGTEAGRGVLGAAISILVALFFAVAVWEITTHLIERRLADRIDEQGEAVVVSGRTRTILGLVRTTIRIVLAVMLVIIVLSEIGVNITPLLAGAGVIGLAIGFGAQTLVKDIITGLFILFEDTMSVGDVASVGGHTGLVEAMSVRTVRLRDLSGTVHVVPYSEVTTVENLTKDFSFALFDVGVAYREDVDHVMQVLHQVGEELRRDRDYRRDILEPLEMLGVNAFGDNAVVIRCRMKTKPIRQWYVMRGFNKLMKKRFDEAGIEIPFPHRTLYFGADRDGTAPAAHIRVEKLERLAEGRESPPADETSAPGDRPDS